MEDFTLEIVKLKGRGKWAVRAVVDGIARYRGFYYKMDALADKVEWEQYHANAITRDIFRAREFNHNFNSAEELGITEVKQ